MFSTMSQPSSEIRQGNSGETDRVFGRTGLIRSSATWKLEWLGRVEQNRRCHVEPSAQDIMKHKALLALLLISLAINVGLGLRVFRKAPAASEGGRAESLPD